MAAAKGPRFDVAGLTEANADAAYAPTVRPVSDLASQPASYLDSPKPAVSDRRETIDLSDLMQGRPDPEVDLVQLGCKVPRYVKQALDAQSRLSGRDQQSLVRDALVAFLDQRHVSVALRKLS